MKKGTLIQKVLIVPLMTLLFLMSSLTQSVSDININNAFNGKAAIVEKGVAMAANKVNWDTVYKNYEVKVYVNDKNNPVVFPAGAGRPFIAEGRTFTPYRVMAEKLGANVGWDNAQRKVTATNTNNTVELFIGNANYKVNGQAKVMNVEPFILSTEGRTYIPARYLTEGLGYTIDFANGGKVMYIVAFTQGQTQEQRKAVLNELINPTPVVVGGKLSDAQVQQIKDWVWNDYGATVQDKKWITTKDKSRWDVFPPMIREKLGNDVIIDERLLLRTAHRDGIFVVKPDNSIWFVTIRAAADGTNSIDWDPTGGSLK